MQVKERANERGFTILEVMVVIVVTAIAIFGISGATLNALHAEAGNDVKASLDDDALAVLSDVRMMTVYDATMITKLSQKSASMTRKLPSGASETITVAVTTTVNPLAEYATATAMSGGASATERIELYQHAPAPGSVVNQ